MMMMMAHSLLSLAVVQMLNLDFDSKQCTFQVFHHDSHYFSSWLMIGSGDEEKEKTIDKSLASKDSRTTEAYII